MQLLWLQAKFEMEPVMREIYGDEEQLVLYQTAALHRYTSYHITCA